MHAAGLEATIIHSELELLIMLYIKSLACPLIINIMHKFHGQVQKVSMGCAYAGPYSYS